MSTWNDELYELFLEIESIADELSYDGINAIVNWALKYRELY